MEIQGGALAPWLAALAVVVLLGGARQRPVARLVRDRPDRLRSADARAFALPASVAALALSGPVAAGLVLAAGLAWSRLQQGRRQAQLASADRAAALEALAVLAGELRAGRPPGEALAGAAEVAVGGTAAALEAGAAAGRTGGEVPAALLVPTGSAVPEVLRGLAACWSVCTELGHGLAAAVDRLEQGVRAAEEQRRAVEAELAGPRATALLLAGLPLGGVALSFGLGADPVAVLLHTPIGIACLTAGLLIDLLGVLWTRALVSRALAA